MRVAGSVRQVNAAFGVDLGRYESPEVAYRGREGLIYVPSRLRTVITGVFGLDTRPVGGHSVCNPRPPVTFGPTPPKVAALYGFPRASATGQTIGILSFGGGYRLDDVSAFYDTLGPGFTLPAIRDVPAGAQNAPGPFGPLPPGGTADTENVGDICVASSVAQGAAIAVYFAPKSQHGWVDALVMAIHPDPGEPAPTVLSVSWFISPGDDGATLAASGAADGWGDAVNARLHDAAIVGITVVVGSGDYGSTAPVFPQSGPPTIADANAHVQ